MSKSLYYEALFISVETQKLDYKHGLKIEIKGIQTAIRDYGKQTKKQKSVKALYPYSLAYLGSGSRGLI